LQHSFSNGSTPSPIPAKEWRVHPRILQAAIPVDAVTATCPAARTSQSSMSSRNSTDFPVPADPVKNT
ncbi:MAG: hypothetical protein JOS17DRAFT_675193, partial [Linnemannia elongata]